MSRREVHSRYCALTGSGLDGDNNKIVTLHAVTSTESGATHSFIVT